SADGARRVRTGAGTACRPAQRGGPLLRRGHGHGRGRGLAHQSPAAAEPAALAVQPHRGLRGNPGRRMKVLVLDRDGVINEDSPDYIRSVEEWQPIPGSIEAIARASK